MKFYLAARYSRRNELREIAKQIREAGHKVTSRWIDTDWEETEENRSSAAPPERRLEFAQIDFDDVGAADVVISFADPKGGGRGGRHVEFGMGLAWYKGMILIGQPEHIFHHYQTVQIFPTWEACWESLYIRSGETIPAKVSPKG